MVSVFVSHSKHDINAVNFFAKIFARIGLQAHFMEWEDLSNTYAGYRISDIIRSQWVEDTKAVIVLLGNNLLNPPNDKPQFTHNWVNFEVGVSAGCKKPVWVFENLTEFIQFPIPYVTDYCLYELDNSELLRNLGDIFKELYKNNTAIKPPRQVTCNNCHAKYNFWNLSITSFHCPVCRCKLELTNV